MLGRQNTGTMRKQHNRHNPLEFYPIFCHQATRGRSFALPSGPDRIAAASFHEPNGSINVLERGTRNLVMKHDQTLNPEKMMQ